MVSHTQLGSQREADTSPLDFLAATEQVVESCHAGDEFEGSFDTSINNRKAPRSSKLTVIVDVDYRPQGWVFVLQSGAFQRILMNLTGNALKYNQSGWVRIHLSAKQQNDVTYVILTVADSGKGISPEFLESRLFTPFSQEDALHAGTGLGMSMVKQLVDNLGGDIRVLSKVGVGTDIRITLPVQHAPSVTSHFPRTPLKAFLAGFESHTDAGRLLRDSVFNYLTTWYQMDIVNDVKFADIVFSDECPELYNYLQTRSNPSGFQNASLYSGRQPLVVLGSSSLRYEFYRQVTNDEVVDFISKPCVPSKLERSIRYCREHFHSDGTSP
jgi:hypothetical protein